MIDKECPAGKGALAYVLGRCPSWSPGNELKCTREKGHEGLCRAKRHGDGGWITWAYRATPEEADRKEEGKEAADLVSDRILSDVMNDAE